MPIEFGILSFRKYHSGEIVIARIFLIIRFHIEY